LGVCFELVRINDVSILNLMYIIIRKFKLILYFKFFLLLYCCEEYGQKYCGYWWKHRNRVLDCEGLVCRWTLCYFWKQEPAKEPVRGQRGKGSFP
jgi:hypothetical protein